MKNSRLQSPENSVITTTTVVIYGQRGASLLVTLIMVAGMVILFTVLARLVSAERRVSRGYSEILRAEMAATAAASDAKSTLLSLFKNFPDAATYWDTGLASTNAVAPGNHPPGTVYMFRDIPANAAHVTATSPRIFARPLVSGGASKEFSEFGKTIPDPANLGADLNFGDTAKVIDLNEPSRFGGSEDGWIGKLPGTSNPSPIRAPWIEILEDPASPKSASNPAIARYAFWMEDESFKLNVNTAKSELRGAPASLNPAVQNQAGTEAVASPTLQGLFATSAAPQDIAEAVVDTRGQLGGYLSPLQVNHAPTPSASEGSGFGSSHGYVLSTTASGLDLSRAGFKRLNLNKAVAGTLGTPGEPTQPTGNTALAPAAKIQRSIDQIAAAIRSNAPKFGQRFYRTTTNDELFHAPTTTTTDANQKNNRTSVTAAHEGIYIKRMATILHDFVSSGINPTFVDDTGTVISGSPIYSHLELGFDMSPSPSDQTNVLQAVGRKNIPQLTEYVWQVRTIDFEEFVPEGSPVPEDGVAMYEIEIDHYFEFWNMSNVPLRPIDGDLGPDPYLVLENQPFITTNNRGGSSTNDVGIGRPFLIRLDDDFLVGGEPTKLVFKPGQATVITTDPNHAAHAATKDLETVYVATALYDPSTMVRVDDGVSTRPFPDPNILPVRVPNVRRYRIHSYDDREGGDWAEVQIAPDMSGAVTTKFIMGNQHGLLDLLPSMPLQKFQNNNCFNLREDGTPAISSCQIGGNNIGGWDPRGKNDPLITRFESPNSSGNYSSYQLGSPNLGTLPAPADEVVWPSDRMEFFGPKSVQSATNPPFLIGGRYLKSIGELGGVAEPALAAHYSVAERRNRRGGGRTLMIGQPDPHYAGTRSATLTATELSYQTSASREWCAWRLADVFSVRDASPDPTNLTVSGQYNPNGILRDGGLVLRALLEGIEFGDALSSDPDISNETFFTEETEKGADGVTATAIQTGGAGGKALARYLAQRLSRNLPTRFSPFWERGEFSQLHIFSPFSQTASSRQQLHSTANIDELNDRGREELFRRLADLITTKGNTFTIYSVGQSLNRLGKPGAVQARKITVRLNPVWDALNEDFNPASSTEVNDRFRQPDRWTLEVLSTENA